MISMSFQKGNKCPYQQILCQEGWCSECAIFLEKALAYSTIEYNSQEIDKNNLVHAN
jgi:hypothetical protein